MTSAKGSGWNLGGFKKCGVSVSEPGEPTLAYVPPDGRKEPSKVMIIVHVQEYIGQHLMAVQQMVDIEAIVPAACVARTPLHQWCTGMHVFRASHVDDPPPAASTISILPSTQLVFHLLQGLWE